MKKYLFRDNHNGYYVTYHPFEVAESLTQEKVNKLIISMFPLANRHGSHLEHLLDALNMRNITFKQYRSTYYKDEDFQEKYHNSADPLPECMYKWDILECISGNY